MKKVLFISILFSFLASVSALNAQEITVPEGYVLTDSLVYRAVRVDTLLDGRDIFRILSSSEGDVNVTQTPNVEKSMRAYIKNNEERKLSGYRIRIFFDNKQTARTESENVLKRFRNAFPEIEAYRSYTNPYFKVTVGDFRTRSEAMAMLDRVKVMFSSAFVVKENIEFPVLNEEESFIIDTIKVLRPVGEVL